MAPKKQAADKKDEKKEKKPQTSPEMRELREKEKALPKVPTPDRAALDADMEKLNSEINTIQEKIKKVNDQISAKSVGKEDHNRAKDEIRTKLNEYGSKIDALEAQKQALRGTISNKQKEGREKRQELNSMKKKIGYDSEVEIDAKISEIEYQMLTETLTLKEEKQLMIKMTELRKTKPELRKYQQLEGTAGGEGGDVGTMKLSIEEVNKELSEARDAKKMSHQALSTLMEARQKVMGNVPELFKEREGFNTSIRELIRKRNEMRDEFNAKNREFNAYLSEVRTIRSERARLERAVRQSEWEERKKGEADDEGPKALPFAEDLQLLDSILKYCRGLVPKEVEKKEEAKKLDVEGSAGHMVLLSKGQRDEEFFFAPTKRKQLKKKGTTGAGKAKALVHSLDTLTFFDKYKVPPPADVAAVPAAMEALQGKVEEYKKKQQKEVEKKAEQAKEAKEAKPAEKPADKTEPDDGAEKPAETPEEKAE